MMVATGTGFPTWSLAQYCAALRDRETIVAMYTLVAPVAADADQGSAAGQAAVRIVRYDLPAGRSEDDSHFVLGVDNDGEELFGTWYESLQAATMAVRLGCHGDVVGEPDA